MTTSRHPATGVELNSIALRRKSRLSQTEIRTANLLLADGDARWLVAAKLGCHPLAITGPGRRPARRAPPIGGHLTTRDARADPRQTTLEDLINPDTTDSAEGQT